MKFSPNFFMFFLLILAISFGLKQDSTLSEHLHSKRTVSSILSSSWSNHPGVEYARKKTTQLLQMRGQGLTQKTITSGMDQQDLIYIYGVPDSVKLVNHGGTKVFRHYTKTALDAIVSSKELKSGPRPFIDPEPHERREYQDLTGVMFTTPEVKASELWMDLDDHADWIEFTLDPEIPVLLCKAGNYLVPLQKNYPDWIRAEYDRYLRTGVVSQQLAPEFERLKASGGMLPRMGIPIRIKRFTRNGVIQEI